MGDASPLYVGTPTDPKLLGRPLHSSVGAASSIGLAFIQYWGSLLKYWARVLKCWAEVSNAGLALRAGAASSCTVLVVSSSMTWEPQVCCVGVRNSYLLRAASGRESGSVYARFGGARPTHGCTYIFDSVEPVQKPSMLNGVSPIILLQFPGRTKKLVFRLN